MTRFHTFLIFASTACLGLYYSPGLAEEFDADVRAAISLEAEISTQAIERLRAEGKPAFERLLQYRKKMEGTRAFDQKLLNQAIDQVGGARYSSVSGLYWHTDFEQALAEAKAANKPILSLRMMGRLTDEYSCANSRFFRTTLYANREISKFLKENYVLHWKSVRPVPKVTIDFGDGRKLERTLTGNSIHYALTPGGQVIDGLPGLNSPAKFLAWLKEMQPNAVAFGQFAGTKPELFKKNLKYWHGRQAGEIARQWKRDLDKVAVREEKNAEGRLGNRRNQPAAAAALRAMPKARVEMPLIANIVRDTRNLELQTQNKTWEQLANLHRGEVKLDSASVELIRGENPAIAGSESQVSEGEGPVLRLIAAFETAIAQDTVRNEYQLHGKLHQWFGEGTAPVDLEKLNEKIYAELFLTPREDPWIGLVPPDTYTGLTNGGVVAPK